MTVSTTTSKVSYNGNGATVTFSVPFPFIADSYLQVIRYNPTTLVETTLTLNSGGANGYTVAGAGGDFGSVTLVTAPTASEQLTILRVVPTTQEADFVANDPFPAETFEDSLDIRAMVDQQLQETVSRALTLPVVVSGVSTELPVPEASRLIGWNASADELQNYSVSELITSDLIAGNFIINTFAGTGAQTAFTLSADPGVEANTQVYIDGVYQDKSKYSVAGTTLTFSVAPTNLSVIEVVQAGAVEINTPATGSVDFTSISATGTGPFLRQTAGALAWSNEFNQNLLGTVGKRIDFQADVSTPIANGVALPTSTTFNSASNFHNDALTGSDGTGSWQTDPSAFAWWYKSGTALYRSMRMVVGASAGLAVLEVDGAVQAASATLTGRAAVASLAETRQTVAAAASTTLNLSLGMIVVLTQDTNITTLAFSNVPISGLTATVTIRRVKDATGTARTITWPASVKWPGGAAPTLSTTASAVDIITLITEDAGTTWYGSYGLAYA